ncbi:ABC transporter permease [Oceanicaulis sp. UBA2681]|uniref:ABC transporter permease n=1 Tax=Oceanicaulis sp. UBA2681 TaxID=1947007 RepID=UPI000EDEF41F|nr:ABC transporter permease [Oceanicaulis sp. UBA2681]HCR66462.1 peptide ABC transporter permease [Oceanicaulis sp.]|tara:strand:- start:3293 stop:4552 length:1260 start_codon:yes stop_codon:yes gene_type:complete
MARLPVLNLALRSIANRRATAILTVLTVAISVMLFLGVEKVRHGARESFENTISGVDLIVGARSSPVNLLLYSVFHIGDATNNITWESYETVASAPGVAWTVPISLGDSHRGHRVIGSTPDLFEHYQYGGGRHLEFASGQPFSDLFGAVIGAAVAREQGYQTGDEIIVAHGMGAVGFIEHDSNPFTVVGVLAPTGTPLDQSVMVTLEAIEAIHLGGATGSGATVSAEELRAMDLTPDQLTAFFVGLDSPVAALRLQRAINTYPEEPLQAVIPGVALAQLWSIVGVAERTLAAVAAFVVLTGLVSILTAILTSLNERRREMAILRALGARPGHVFVLLVAEAALVALAGAVLGAIATYGALNALAPLLEARFGILLPGLAPGLYDLTIVGAVTGAAALLGLFPAWRAYRNSLADGMTIKL